MGKQVLIMIFAMIVITGSLLVSLSRKQHSAIDNVSGVYYETQARLIANSTVQTAISDLKNKLITTHDEIFDEIKGYISRAEMYMAQENISGVMDIYDSIAEYNIRPIEVNEIDLTGYYDNNTGYYVNEDIVKILFEISSTAKLTDANGAEYEATTVVHYDYGFKTRSWLESRPFAFNVEIDSFLLNLRPNGEVELRSRVDNNWRPDAYNNDDGSTKEGDFKEEDIEKLDTNGIIFIKGDTRLRGRYPHKLTLFVRGNVYLDHDVNYSRPHFDHRAVTTAGTPVASSNSASDHLSREIYTGLNYAYHISNVKTWERGIPRYRAAVGTNTLTTLPYRQNALDPALPTMTTRFTFYSSPAQTIRTFADVTGGFIPMPSNPTYYYQPNRSGWTGGIKPPRNNLTIYAAKDENGHGGNILIACNICDSHFDLWDIYINAAMYAEGRIEHEKMGQSSHHPADNIAGVGNRWSGTEYSSWANTPWYSSTAERECKNHVGYENVMWPKGIIRVFHSGEDPTDPLVYESGWNSEWTDFEKIASREEEGSLKNRFHEVRYWQELPVIRR